MFLCLLSCKLIYMLVMLLVVGACTKQYRSFLSQLLGIISTLCLYTITITIKIVWKSAVGYRTELLIQSIHIAISNKFYL